MNTGRFLFWLGIVVMIVELIANLIGIQRIAVNGAFNVNATSWIVLLFGSFFQGGVLIGLGRIIELLQNKKCTNL